MRSGKQAPAFTSTSRSTWVTSIVLKSTGAVHASKASTRAKSNAVAWAGFSGGLKYKKLLGTDRRLHGGGARRGHASPVEAVHDTVVQSCGNDLQLRTKRELNWAYITRVVKENDNEEEGVGRKRNDVGA